MTEVRLEVSKATMTQIAMASSFKELTTFDTFTSSSEETGMTLVGMRPDDALVGDNPLRFKCLRDDETILVYLANPSGKDPETDNPGVKKPTVAIDLPKGKWTVQWFNPRSGELFDKPALAGNARHRLTPPHDDRSSAADWVLLLRIVE